MSSLSSSDAPLIQAAPTTGALDQPAHQNAPHAPLADQPSRPPAQTVEPPTDARLQPQPLWRSLMLGWLPRLIVAAIFITAGWNKISTVEKLTQFVKEVRAYRLVPLEASNVMAYVLPWLELLTVGGLVLGVFRKEARILLVGMLATFLVAKGYAYFVHNVTECGCVPKDSLMYPLFNGVWGYVTNVVLIALLVIEGLATRSPRGPARLRRSPAQASV